MKHVKKSIAGAVAAAAVAVTVSACGPTQLNDLRNTHSTYPDFETTILNVDNFPNVSLLCFHGSAMITTTRDMDAVQLDPDLNAFCATKIGQVAK